MTFVNVAASDQVAEGQIGAWEVEGQQVAVARVGGRVFAFSDICTHRGCTLSTGELDGTEIECECHGSVFSIETGAVVNPPATDPIATFSAREADGRIEVEV
ncbi:MAG TPA: non-heme iron oxygenase ferredoxin subunit [Actinomycetota bacterium]|jgi:nitrite reductase/ring-hydroxylating ferredoxin subunit